MAEYRVLKEFARLDKSSTQVLVVSLNEIEERRYLDIRTWFKANPVTSELRPGKGATVPTRLLPDFLAAVEKAAALVGPEGNGEDE